MGLAEAILAPLSITTARGWLLPALSLVLFTVPCQAAERQFLHDHVPAIVTNATPVGRSSRWARLELGIGLPLREREALTNLLQPLGATGAWDRSAVKRAGGIDQSAPAAL